MKIAVIVCPNGLGHLKRVCDVTKELMKMNRKLKFDIWCQGWQLEKLGIKNKFKNRIRWHKNLMEPGVKWETQKDLYQDGRLIKWENRLKNCKSIKKADVVISDNLVGMLSIRPDTILMGSFLWSDVFSGFKKLNKNISAFIKRERQLLETHKPFMVCVNDSAMEGVNKRTRAIRCSWMCERIVKKKKQNKIKKIILLLETKYFNETLIKSIASQILTREDWALYTSHEIRKMLDKEFANRIQPFKHNPKSFQSSDIVICRPGIGIVTQCVGSKTPMVVVYENNNVEMKHNARRLSQLGWAIDLGSDPHQKTLYQNIHNALNHTHWNRMVAQISKAKTKGHEQAAQWLSRYISNLQMAGDFKLRSEGI